MKLAQLRSLYKLIGRESRNMRKSVPKQPRQRASAFVLESLENRVLLSATPMDATTTTPDMTATVVTTDKADYSPGETAVITTSNTSADGLKFGDGELVQFQVTRTDGIQDYAMGNIPWFVTDGVGGFDAYQEYDANGQAVDRNADGLADLIRPDNDGTVNGSISTNWFVEDQYLNSSLLLTATGQTTGAVATTEFTDSPRVGTVTVGSQSGVLVSGVAGSTNYTFDVFRDSNNNNAAPATVAITGLPVGVTVSGLTTSITLAGTNNTTTSAYSGTFTLNTPSSIAASSYNFTVQVTATAGSGSDSSTGAGSLVVSPATVATTTTVSSSDDTSTFGDSVTFTATVARTTGTGAPTGSVTFNIAGVGSGLVGTAGSTTATTATWTYTTTATALTAGNHPVQAFYVHSGSFTDSTSGNITQTVSKASSTTTTVGAGPFTYDGTTYTGGSGTVTGAGGLNGSATSLTYVGNQIDAGSYTVTAHYAGDANHLGSDGAAVTITINKASSTTTTVGAGPFTYDGTTYTGGSGTVTGAGGLNGSATSLTYVGNQIDAGSYTVTAHYAGDANHLGSDGAAVTITINKASSTTTTVGAGPFTYDGTTYTGGSGTVTGAGGLNGSATSLTYVGNQIDAGSYTVTAHYAGDANHLGSDGAAVTITINKASSTTTTVGAGPFTYDGTTYTGGSGTVTGAGGLNGSATSLTYVGNQIDAGSYTVTAHYAGDANHLGSDGAAVTITINKASSTTTTVGAGPFTYDGTTYTGGSGTVTGAGGLNGSATSLTYVGNQIDAGSYTVTAHYAGDANHLGSDGAAVTITINKASSTTTTVGAGPFTYDGTTYTGGSGTVTGAGGLNGSATSLTYVGNQIDAGSYTVTAHYAGDANHLGSDGAAVTITINKASSTTTTVGAGPFTYDGTTYTGGSGTVTGAGGLNGSATSLTYVGNQIDAGSYTVTAHYAGDANHLGSDGAAVTITINKASSTTTTVGAGPFTYDGTTYTGGSGTVTGAGGLNGSATSLTYVGNQIDAGSYTVTAHYAGDANHLGSDGAAVTITINKASSTTTTVGAGPFTYDGTTYTGGSGTVTGAGGLNGSATSLTYVGNQIDAGSYTVTAHYAGDANHLGSDGAAVTITINKASSTTTTVGAGPFTYDGTTYTGGSGTVTGAGGLNGSATSLTYVGNQIDAGSYTVTAHYAGDANHLGSDGAAVTITINKASSTTTTVGAGPFTYDGTTYTGGSGTVTGAGGLNGSATSLTYVGNQIDAGSYTVTAHYAGDANHLGSDGAAVTITINKASSTTTTVGAGPFTYDGTTYTGGSGTVTGAGGLNGSATSLTYVGNQIDAGSYTVTAHYAGDANHLGSDGAAVTITINKASSTTTTVGAGPFTYDGTTYTGGSGTVTGAGGLNGSATSLTYVGNQIDAGSYTVTAHYAGDANHLGSDGAAVTITINKASSTTTTVGAGPFAYDGTTYTGGSGTVTGAGGLNGSATSLTYVGNQIDAGSYTVTAHYAGDANHLGSDGAAVTITINKASSTTTATGASFIYNGSTHTGGSAVVSGAGTVTGSAVLSYSGDQINAGTYTVTATYAGDANHTGSSDSATITIGKATLTGLATTQSALNIAKQGALVFSLNSVTGMVNGDTLVSLLSSMSFTLKIGVNTYEYAPSVAIDTHGDGDASNDTVVVTYSMKNGGDAGLLAADLQALNMSDGTASTSASNAQVDAIFVNMSTANYTFSDDALTKLFYSLK